MPDVLNARKGLNAQTPEVLNALQRGPTASFLHARWAQRSQGARLQRATNT